ncbi:hypothetical protein ES703_45562 [subsurface metagenome]
MAVGPGHIIDDNTFKWFSTSIAGIENIMSISLKDLATLNEFSSYDAKRMNKENALIRVDNKKLYLEGIKSVDVQKIGTIQEKKSQIDIYNLHLQATIDYSNLFGKSRVKKKIKNNITARSKGKAQIGVVGQKESLHKIIFYFASGVAALFAVIIVLLSNIIK